MRFAYKLLLVVAFGFLVLPNLFHEPLHWLAIQMIGGEASIEFAFPRPLTHAAYPYSEFNIWLYLCFPIVVQIFTMSFLALSRSALAFGLNTYFISDLYFQFTSRTNEFADLRFLGNGSFYSIVISCMLIAAIILYLLHLWSIIEKFKSKIELPESNSHMEILCNRESVGGVGASPIESKK
jgi:hypothetical protein